MTTTKTATEINALLIALEFAEALAAVARTEYDASTIAEDDACSEYQNLLGVSIDTSREYAHARVWCKKLLAAHDAAVFMLFAANNAVKETENNRIALSAKRAAAETAAWDARLAFSNASR